MQNSSTSTASPLSPTAWPRNAFPVTLTVIVVVGAIVVVLGATIVELAIAMLTGAVHVADFAHSPPIISADFALWSQYAAYVPVSIYFLLVLPALARRPLHELGFRMPTASDLGVGVVGAGVMWIGVTLASAVVEGLTHRHDTEPAIQLLQQIHTPGQKFEFILMAVAIAPLVEELAFRAFLFNAFRRWTSFWVAAIASGLLFGFAHVQSLPGLVTLGVPLAVGGIVLAGVYERTGCYWSNVLTHALFNSVSVIAVFAFGAKP